ncbi:MAG: acetylxylan esterase [Fimbriimonadaceae bacterium]
MPLTDLPLDQLFSYTGRNPRPADFDAYWSAALDELATVDSRVALAEVTTPAPFACAFDLRWTGVGGAEVYAKLMRPKAGSSGPALVKFHGYSMHSGDWFDLLPYVAAGFTVAAMDVRGQAGLSVDPGGAIGNTLQGHIVRGVSDRPEKLFYRSVFLDAAQLAGIVMGLDGVDPTRVGVTGWSQGGGLTLACAALEPRVARIAPVYPFLCDYQRVWEMDLAANNAYDEIRSWFRRFDPRHEREAELFIRLGYIDNQHLAPRITAQTLMVSGLMDVHCPISTQFAAYNRIAGAKDVLIYPDFGHEGLPEANDRIFAFMCEML